MPFPTATSRDRSRTEERRSSPRRALKGRVALVFFGEDNWGKLTNMSERGMAFEFAKPPSLRERVNFTIQVMGCMPMAPKGKALGGSFEAPGEVVWTRDFERGAGVRFVDLEEANREQIREWLSFETSTNTSAPMDEVEPELPQSPGEVFAPRAPESKTRTAPEKKETLREWDAKQTLNRASREVKPAFLEPQSLEEEPYEASRWRDLEGAGEQPVPESSVYPHPSVARLTFLVVCGCLAAFAMTAGAKIFMTSAAHQVDTEAHASDQPPETGVSTSEVHASSSVAARDASPVPSIASSSAVSAPPFQVDVLDANGQRWILWFVHGGAKNKDNQIPYGSARSSNSSSSTVTNAKGQETAQPEVRHEAHTFTMMVPNVSHPSSSEAPSNSSAEAPAIQPDPMPSSGDPFGGALGRKMAPAAPAVHAPTGGMVQQPRLIRATFPVYPQLAKSSRVSGDVIVDALIDASGNVTAAKAISGPVLLRQAAMETVRHWKYEPARLDGQAVAMHLAVTVRFRLN